MQKKQIGIISGKGGVGKTSLTASLASLANNDPEISPIIMDCDVDAPNLALILPAENEKSIRTKDTYTTLKATFLEEKCIHCRNCIEENYCEFNALEWDQNNKIPKIKYLACEGCGACQVLCLEHAFEINPVKSGEIISYKTKKGPNLVYGKTQLGSTTSGKLVSESKEFAKNLEGFEENDLIIIDGPPGIGCPVIATVSGLDYVITICEPTPSGLHDVIRAIDVVQQFKIPFGIVINKSDLKSSFQEEFNTFIDETGYEVLGRIPFDLSIAQAMSHAEPVVDYAPESKASQAIQEIYIKLKDQIWNHN
ncbi:MAG: P-loop NTPase [Candidatus Lokiarchaeota archaeon]|nr:P-loop NTPase [Candidatus Lokiarchaeota archaeon]MBD3202035.1 P-loop NTPase [Candidatus Lokiarchaeota archaeon]